MYLVEVGKGGAPSTERSETVSQSEGGSSPRAVSAAPRAMPSGATSRRFTASRWPGSPRAVRTPCTCTPRRRPAPPAGPAAPAAVSARGPRRGVPVTTVPWPATLNTRSTGR